MVVFFKQNRIMIAIVAVVLALSMALVIISVSAAAANAEAPFTESGEITIGHITDTHYYPFRLGYYGNDLSMADEEEFFYNWIMDKSTKMWLESEFSFDATLKIVLEKAPDYMILSGDAAQDGELIAHIDVANRLRKLQNAVRAASGNNKFQIFVIMGNHDLYNHDTFRFDNAKGMREDYYYTTRLEAVKIYAGLGYPNMTEEEANIFYAPLLANEMAGDYGYVYSGLSDDFTYMWEFVKTKVDNSSYEFEADEVTMATLLAADRLLLARDSLLAGDKHCYSYMEFRNDHDIKIGQMTFMARRKDNAVTFVGVDVVQSNSVDLHVLGGQVQASTVAFLANNKNFARPNLNNPEKTVVVGTVHHSVLPHWGMEEQATTGFILYNWQEMADFLADFGMRYVYTGHMHANDIVTHVSFNGNQIIDLETSATVSVGSQVKYTTIVQGSAGESYVENTYAQAYPNIVVDCQPLYDKVFKGDKYNYVARNKVASVIDADKKQIKNYSDYARRRIYDNAVINTLGGYLRPSITNMLGGMLSNVKPISIAFFNIDLAKFSDDVIQLANNLIAEVSVKGFADYQYKGTNELYNIPENKVFGFIEDLIMDVVEKELEEGVTVFGLVIEAYISHCIGNDVAYMEDLLPANQLALNQIFSGQFVDYLLNTLLDRNTGLYKLIEVLQDTTLDLSKGLSFGFKNLIEPLVVYLGVDDFSLSEFNLGDVLKAAGGNGFVQGLLEGLPIAVDLEHMSLTEIVDDIVDKYVTESFKKSLGEYAYDVITAFALDGGHQEVVLESNQNGGKGVLLKVYSDESYTFISKTRTEIITVENGKLPDMLTTNFGSDPATTQNFTYFTDRRVKSGSIEYAKADANGMPTGTVQKKTATTKIYGTTKPLIDLGIWCQTGYVEVARHTVSLTGLTPDTTYAYRIGKPAGGGKNEYMTKWYTFKTGPAASAGFEVLVNADLQSSTQYAYERISVIYDNIDQLFPQGIDFVLNAGDVTDNARNLSQYRWFINSSAEFYASHSVVVASGNHDEKHFERDKAGNVDYYGGVSEDADVSEYNYLWWHYNLSIPKEQVLKTGFYYSFDYAGVHFAVIDTNDIANNGLAAGQYSWLSADLEANKNKVTVVLMHKSIYSAGSHSYDNDVVGLRAQLTPLYAEKGVDLVIAGHDHTYTETFTLDEKGNKILLDANGKNKVSGNKGVTYLTMGTMGEKFYNYVSNNEIPVQNGEYLHKEGYLAEPTLGKLVFDGENLYYYGYQFVREYAENGTLIGGSFVKINHAFMDYNLLIGIIIVGLSLVLAVTCAIAVGIRSKRSRKNGSNKN